MWSTLTARPTFEPQSLANGSNQTSWLGTKWLQSRIDKDPDSFFVGSVNVVSVGAPALLAASLSVGDGALPSLSPPHAASTADAAIALRNVRRVIPDDGK
jgi:hypothetical protein